MLNIYELESLILADINTFNEIYGIGIEEAPNPMLIEMSKELLKEKSNGNFRESDNPEIFKKLDLEKMKTRHKAFAIFCNKMEDFINNL